MKTTFFRTLTIPLVDENRHCRAVGNARTGRKGFHLASGVKRYPQVAGFLLAGGASSRMGRDKGLLEFGGVPLILHTARLLEPLVAEVTVVGTPRRHAALGL